MKDDGFNGQIVADYDNIRGCRLVDLVLMNPRLFVLRAIRALRADGKPASNRLRTEKKLDMHRDEGAPDSFSSRTQSSHQRCCILVGIGVVSCAHAIDGTGTQSRASGPSNMCRYEEAIAKLKDERTRIWADFGTWIGHKVKDPAD